MTGLADVDGFIIYIQVCVWLGFRILFLDVQRNFLSVHMFYFIFKFAENKQTEVFGNKLSFIVYGDVLDCVLWHTN